jgi:hypothetical protein
MGGRHHPFDQPLGQFQLRPQLHLPPRHRAIIPLVIVAREMQQPMQHQNLQLARQRMPMLDGLLPRSIHADRQIAFFLLLDESVGGERQDIGRLVHAAELPVELANCRIRSEQNSDVAFQANSFLCLGEKTLQGWDGWDSLRPGDATNPHGSRRQHRSQ